MKQRTTACLVLILLAVLAAPLAAQNKLLTIDDLFDPKTKVDFSGDPPMGLRWFKDGLHYLYLKTERGRGMDRERETGELLKVNALTGQSQPLFDRAKMEAAFARLPGISADDTRRLARRGSHPMNETRTALLANHGNDIYYWEFGSDRAVRLTNTPEEETGEEFSPDGRMVSFVRGNNLYVLDLEQRRERAVTRDGGPKILNGRLDWVYEEELYGRGQAKGYWWSPDSARLAFLRFDEAPVQEFTVLDHVPRLQTVESTPYPKAGDPNPKVRLGIAAAAGGAVRWVDTFPYENIEFLISRVAWTADSKKVAYQAQNREQTWLDLNYADASDGKSKTLFRETSKAWVEVIDNPRWLKDGSFLWQSERTGWRHIYHYAADGKLIRPVTEGQWEVRSLYGADEAGGWAYFSSNQHSPGGPQIYRIHFDGTGLTRVSKTEGTHSANFNPTFTHFIDTWSDINTPTQVRLYEAGGELARVIDENKVPAIAQYKLGKPEFLQVKTRDGFVMEAMMLRPPDFDPKKKYPVMSFTYSGPHAPSVRNAWGGAGSMWHQMLAQKGYIIWVCDNRSASGKSVESVWPAYRNLGELELRDLEDGLAWLKKQPYVDGARIGLSGWSYGGYMTSYALTHSTSFRIGIAGGSVTDWRLYDSIYTERYMGLPQANPEGYKKSAPLSAAKDLHGKLLLIHGAMDDNVHMQNTLQFVYELQKAGKQFDLMLYPKSRHGVRDPLLVKHMRSLMTDFILANL